ncbi:MAG: sigma-70 family RNA polymerase sigma factor [Actinomycetota bacterium]
MTSDELAIDLGGDDDLRFDDWYHQEYRRVVALVYTLSGSRTAAEEIAQDAFLEAHRSWGTISNYADPGGWVRKVAMNKARSSRRRRAAEVRAYTKHLGRERRLPAELPEPSHEFWSAVRNLPAKQAQVIALHYLEDRPVDDIADILDLSPGTVKTHLHRGRRNLAETLGHNDVEEHR